MSKVGTQFVYKMSSSTKQPGTTNTGGGDNGTDAAAAAKTTSNKKQLILHAFVMSCSGHQSPGLWTHPRDKSWDFNNVRHWVELAQLLEKGHFHGMFIADVLVSAATFNKT